MRSRTKGFTLIELMTAVAIVGVVAAIAIPFIQDYLVRSRVSEGLVVAGTAKTLVIENAGNGVALDQGWTNLPATENVESIGIDSESGRITMSFSTLAKGVTVDLIPEAPVGRPIVKGTPPEDRIAWKCTVPDVAMVRYVPSSCR